MSSLEVKLEKVFGYELFDDEGVSNCFSVGECGETFIVYHKDNSYCIYGDVDQIDVDDVTSIAFVTAIDRWFNCPLMHVFDFEDQKHVEVDLYRTAFSDVTDEEFNQRIADELLSEINCESKANLWFDFHQTFRELSDGTFYKVEEETPIINGVQTYMPVFALMA